MFSPTRLRQALDQNSELSYIPNNHEQNNHVHSPLQSKTPLEFAEAQSEFVRLLENVRGDCVGDFLSWIHDSFTTDGAQVMTEQRDAEVQTLLLTIIGDLRKLVPPDAILASERTVWPQDGLDSDCDPSTTVHVDSFLYDDNDVEQLVEQQMLSRHYCRVCGSHSTAQLTLISHSWSLMELRYVFTVLLPPEVLQQKTLLDIGSRLGGVLYAACTFSPGIAKVIGIEMNKDFCDIQEQIIQKYGFTAQALVICDDIVNRPDLISAAADVIMLNNVFQFFQEQDQQKVCWSLIRKSTRKSTIMITSPDLATLTGHLKLDFELDEWVEEIPTALLAAKFSGSDKEKFDDCSKIHMYRVR